MYIVKLHADKKGWLDLPAKMNEVVDLVRFALSHDLEVRIEKAPAEVTPDAKQGD